MSKNNHTYSEQAVAETKVVKKDLVQTVIINVAFIAILIGLYFWNEAAGQPLSNWIKGVLGL